MEVEIRFDENGEVKCPECEIILTVKDNVEHKVENGVYRSILRCCNENCRFEAVLDEATEEIIEKEMEE